MNETEMRELDAWIAEHVMGFKLNANGMIETWPRPGVRSDLTVRDYSTNPADALKVLERSIQFKGEEAKIIYSEDFGWSIVNGTELIEGHGETLPLAICLFAKKLFS